MCLFVAHLKLKLDDNPWQSCYFSQRSTQFSGSEFKSRLLTYQLLQTKRVLINK